MYTTWMKFRSPNLELNEAFYEVVQSVFKSLPPIEILKHFRYNPGAYRAWYEENFASYQEQNVSNAGPSLMVSDGAVLNSGGMFDPYFGNGQTFQLTTPTSGRIVTVQLRYSNYTPIVDSIAIDFPTHAHRVGSIHAASDIYRGVNLLWQTGPWAQEQVYYAFRTRMHPIGTPFSIAQLATDEDGEWFPLEGEQ